MSGTIEPAGTNAPEGAPAGAHGTGDQSEPSIIPSVAEHAHAGPSTSTKVLLVMLSLACTVAVMYLLCHMIHRPMKLTDATAPPPAGGGARGGVEEVEPVLPAANVPNGSAHLLRCD